jgi:hypothetical protein
MFSLPHRKLGLLKSLILTSFSYFEQFCNMKTKKCDLYYITFAIVLRHQPFRPLQLRHYIEEVGLVLR